MAMTWKDVSPSAPPPSRPALYFSCSLDGKEKIYHGFEPLARVLDYDHAGTAWYDLCVMCVWFDGEPNVWLVESRDKISALFDYYIEQWGTNVLSRMTMREL